VNGAALASSLSARDDGSAPLLLRVRDLVKSRGRGYRLRIPELEVRAGARLILLGDSGSGKSTTLDLLALVLKPDGAGDFLWQPGAGEFDLKTLWRDRRADRLGRLRREGLGYVLQTGGLLPFLTVRENIILPARLKKMDSRASGRRLDDLLERLRLGHLRNKFPGQISVGERQRCAIARAVIHEPALILADEPTASLDPPTADQVFELLLNLSRDVALIVATHDVNRARRHDFTIHQVVCAPKPAEGGLIEAALRPHRPE
jgi:putative ABC transport system ATP-binding protein